MRHLTHPRERKYIKRYGFLFFAKKFGDKYGKKLVDTATKTVKNVERMLKKLHLKKLFKKWQKQQAI